MSEADPSCLGSGVWIRHNCQICTMLPGLLLPALCPPERLGFVPSHLESLQMGEGSSLPLPPCSYATTMDFLKRYISQEARLCGMCLHLAGISVLDLNAIPTISLAECIPLGENQALETSPAF